MTTFVKPEDLVPVVLELTPAASIRTRPVRWLWEGWLPLGKVAMLDGRPGLGKSGMAIDIAARTTTGRQMPDGFDPGLGPRDVIVVTAEDDWEDTVVPRLIAAGADLTRVHRVEDLDLPADCGRLRTAIELVAAVLVVFDPVVAFVPAKFDLYKDQSARLVLKPLGLVAAATRCAVLCLRHVNKATGQSAQDRGTGSVAIGGAARVNLIAGPDPDVDGQYVLAPIKVNVGIKHAPDGYRIDSRNVVTDEGSTTSVPILAWLGEVDVTADDLVTAGKQGEATIFLRNALAEGPVAAKELEKQAKNEGLSWTGAVRRASERIPVVKSPSEFGGEWQWSLPSSMGRPSLHDSAQLRSDRSDSVVQNEPEMSRDEQPSMTPTAVPHGSPHFGRDANAAGFAKYLDESTGGMWAKLDKEAPA